MSDNTRRAERRAHERRIKRSLVRDGYHGRSASDWSAKRLGICAATPKCFRRGFAGKAFRDLKSALSFLEWRRDLSVIPALE